MKKYVYAFIGVILRRLTLFNLFATIVIYLHQILFTYIRGAKHEPF